MACRCCNGRVVSVLEGGYNINGGVVSAFARSVEAHVRGLAEPHLQVGAALLATPAALFDESRMLAEHSGSGMPLCGLPRCA